MDDKNITEPAAAQDRIFYNAWQIIRDSYLILEKKFWTLISISFIGSLAYIGVTTGIAFTVSTIFALPASVPMLLRFVFPILAVVLSAAAIILQIWSGAALIVAANSPDKIGINNSYRLSKEKLIPYAWAGFLGIVVVFAGLLFFIIPGLVASVWFILATIVVVVENRRGLEALFASKELVRNYWRQTAVFLSWIMAIVLVAAYASLALSLQPDIWSLFINTISGAFIATSLLALYRKLFAEKGFVAPNVSEKRKRRYAFFAYIGTMAIAFTIFVTVFFGLKFKNDVVRIVEADAIQQSLTAYDKKQGTFPQAISQLVPDYLPTVPVDPFLGKPFDYVSTDNGKNYLMIIDYDNFGVQALTSNSSPIPGGK